MKKLLLSAACLIGLGSVAWAHGAATWIMTDPRTAHCCGPSDCFMEMADDVRPEANGWIVVSTGQHFTRDQAEVFPSIDNNFWTCRKYPERLGARAGMKFVRCLFVPVQS